MADALKSWLGMMLNTVNLLSGRRLSECCCVSALVAAVVCCVSSLAVADDILNIGDAPPPLAVSSFVKGDKIDKLDSDKTYVVEFWATWCGPCRESIPHLTELAHQFKDRGVQFIGVDVWEDNVGKVQPFVDKMGEKMDYNVALDSVPDDTKPREGTMAKTWLAAADEHGIPTAFVIQDGKIAWIGYPKELEKPLAKITSGQWDLAEMSKQRLVDKDKQRKFAEARESVVKPYYAKDYKATLAVIDQVTKDQPELVEMFDSYKFTSLCNSGDTDAGLAFGEQMFQQHKDDPGYLNDKFWDVINPDQNLPNGADLRVAQLALKACAACRRTYQGRGTILSPYLGRSSISHWRCCHSRCN